MAKPLLHIEGLDQAIARVKSIGDLKKVKGVLLATGLILKGYLARYPPQRRITRASVYGKPFKTDKQRRYFFYALRTGKIRVPYQRGSDPNSERFKASWAITTRNRGMTVVVGNDTTYGPYVMDPDRQSLFMKAMGWPTTEEVVEQEGDTLSRYMMFQLTKALDLDETS